jgi:hypothetical protein
VALIVIILTYLCTIVKSGLDALNRRLADHELRVDNLAEATRVLNRNLLDFNRSQSVTQDQVEDARRRGNLK